MPNTAQLPLTANRWEPFKYRIRFEGLDFTGGSFSAEVRDRKDGGLVRASLATVGSIASEGVRLESVANEAIDFGSGIGVLTVPVSTLHIRINEATMEAMEVATEAGDDGNIWWDLQVTAPAVNDAVKYRAVEGPFIVKAGVTGSG